MIQAPRYDNLPEQENTGHYGKIVKPARNGDWSYWESFYEINAPTFK